MSASRATARSARVEKGASALGRMDLGALDDLHTPVFRQKAPEITSRCTQETTPKCMTNA